MEQERLICHKCEGILFPEHMGRKCPYCGEWIYFHKSRKAMEDLTP